MHTSDILQTKYKSSHELLFYMQLHVTAIPCILMHALSCLPFLGTLSELLSLSFTTLGMIAITTCKCTLTRFRFLICPSGHAGSLIHLDDQSTQSCENPLE